MLCFFYFCMMQQTLDNFKATLKEVQTLLRDGYSEKNEQKLRSIHFNFKLDLKNTDITIDTADDLIHLLGEVSSKNKKIEAFEDACSILETNIESAIRIISAPH